MDHHTQYANIIRRQLQKEENFLFPHGSRGVVRGERGDVTRNVAETIACRNFQAPLSSKPYDAPPSNR